MLWVFIAMLPEIIAFVILIMIALIFIFFRFKKISYCGSNPYIALLLSFLISGAGLVYLGLPQKGLLWYLLHLGAILIAPLISHAVNVEDKYLGWIIMLPFLVQLYVTGIEYKKKHGDITW